MTLFVWALMGAVCCAAFGAGMVVGIAMVMRDHDLDAEIATARAELAALERATTRTIAEARGPRRW